MHVHPLVVATTNRGKLEELRTLLAGLPLQILSVDEVLGHSLEVVEDGKTFRDNAQKKARAVAEATMMMTLADDSGLEVLSLDGAPGVQSARFASERASDAENNAALLAALENMGDAEIPPNGEHEARFRCVLALIDPYTNDGAPLFAEGTCEGAITRAPRGRAGFGYDPLFVVKGGALTLAELGAAEKNAVSHRARACAALRPLLERAIAEREEQVARAK